MSTERTNAFHACPCCGWWGLEYPAYDKLPQPPFGDLGQPPYNERYGSASFQCCHCCGFEFGYDCDPAASGRHGNFRDYLREWAEAGRNWFRPLERPEDWSLPAQLTAAGLPPLDQ
ncbi:MAG: hypothetical protein ACK493_12485 [Planctomycetota bacterium]|jgi:hypothetical protein|nr:hypothetical protein [Blastopirellula sp.]